jgi:hypothetical protein
MLAEDSVEVSATTGAVEKKPPETEKIGAAACLGTHIEEAVLAQPGDGVLNTTRAPPPSEE